MKKIILVVLLLLVPITVKGIEVSATSAIVMDIDSNRILYSKNIHEKRGIASISKIMTAIIAIEEGILEEIVEVGDEIDKAYGSGIYIKKGEILTLKDLLYGLLLRSGNDSALSIAHKVGGSEEKFVELMNKKAKDIGMTNTTFNNPSGLDDNGGNISTAYDMALLSSYAYHNEIYREITGTKKYTLKTNMNTYVWDNKNRLLFTYKYATGGKTGYTDVAKRTLVTMASKDNLNLTVVTLNDGNDFEDHQNLYEETFGLYKSYVVLKKGKIEVINENYYDYLYIENDYRYPFLKNEIKSVILHFKIDKILNYKEEDNVGKVLVKIGDNVIHEEQIYVKKIDKKENIFAKIYRWIFK